MRILIAEDSAPARLILQNAVEGLGHECIVAQDGNEAWRLFEEMGANTIISDWMMPGLDGLELCQKVRDHGPSYTYFIFLTALEEKHHVLAGMEAGADDYLTKPLDIDELKMRLIAATRVTSLHREVAQRDDQREPNQLLAELAQFGPPLMTSVVLNGRTLMLDSAMKILQQLPSENTRVGRRGNHIFVTPDPFSVPTPPDRSGATETAKQTQPSDQAALTHRLRQGLVAEPCSRRGA